MPRTEDANRKIRESQRANILDAALRVFARKGKETTMADVAEEAAVSYGLAYRYFPSKEILFRSLIETQLKESSAQWGGWENSADSAGNRLGSLVHKLIANRRDSPETSQLFRQVLADSDTPEDLRKLAAIHGQRVQKVLRQSIIEAQRSGEVAAGDPDQLVTALTAYFDGLSNLSSWAPERLKRHFPDPEIIMRIFQPTNRDPDE